MGKSWSPHTKELIITNRVYIGEKHFRDIAVTGAHPAIITTDSSTSLNASSPSAAPTSASVPDQPHPSISAYRDELAAISKQLRQQHGRRPLRHRV